MTYYKEGNLEIRPAAVMSAGSLLGALAGVKVNLLIPEDVMQIILYLVVARPPVPSILLRKGGGAGSGSGAEKLTGGRKAAYFLLGNRNGNSVRGIRSGRSGPGHAAAHAAGGSPHIRQWECPCSTPYLSLFLRPGGYLWNSAGNRELFLLLVPVLAAHGIGVGGWQQEREAESTRTFSSGSLRWDLSPLPWSSCFSDWSQGCRFAVEAGGSR